MVKLPIYWHYVNYYIKYKNDSHDLTVLTILTMNNADECTHIQKLFLV